MLGRLHKPCLPHCSPRCSLQHCSLTPSLDVRDDGHIGSIAEQPALWDVSHPACSLSLSLCGLPCSLIESAEWTRPGTTMLHPNNTDLVIGLCTRCSIGIQHPCQIQFQGIPLILPLFEYWPPLRVELHSRRWSDAKCRNCEGVCRMHCPFLDQVVGVVGMSGGRQKLATTSRGLCRRLDAPDALCAVVQPIRAQCPGGETVGPGQVRSSLSSSCIGWLWVAITISASIPSHLDTLHEHLLGTPSQCRGPVL